MFLFLFLYSFPLSQHITFHSDGLGTILVVFWIIEWGMVRVLRGQKPTRVQLGTSSAVPPFSPILLLILSLCVPTHWNSYHPFLLFFQGITLFTRGPDSILSLFLGLSKGLSRECRSNFWHYGCHSLSH